MVWHVMCPNCGSKDDWEWYYTVDLENGHAIDVKAGQCRLCGTMIRKANATGKDWYVFKPAVDGWLKKLPKYVHMHYRKSK